MNSVHKARFICGTFDNFHMIRSIAWCLRSIKNPLHNTVVINQVRNNNVLLNEIDSGVQLAHCVRICRQSLL